MTLLSRRRASEEGLLTCPRDGHDLAKIEVEGVTIDRCDACGGTWFDEQELRRVAGSRELERLATRLPQVRVPSGFLCPRCGSECAEAHVAEVAVDTCVKCEGVWLDRGELAEAKRQIDVRHVLEEQGPRFREFLAKL